MTWNKEQKSEYNRNYREKHRDEWNKYQKKYYENHREELSQRHTEYYNKNKDKIKEKRKTQDFKINHNEYCKNWRELHQEQIKNERKIYYEEHREELLELKRKDYQNIKSAFFEMYGNKCNCCGETNRVFLSLDHVQNDGKERRKKYGMNNQQEYKNALKEYRPDLFQVLCYNCNHAKQLNGGTCPHTYI
jgi:hypothetical protein